MNVFGLSIQWKIVFLVIVGPVIISAVLAWQRIDEIRTGAEKAIISKTWIPAGAGMTGVSPGLRRGRGNEIFPLPDSLPALSYFQSGRDRDLGLVGIGAVDQDAFLIGPCTKISGVEGNGDIHGLPWSYRSRGKVDGEPFSNRRMEQDRQPIVQVGGVVGDL